MAVARHVVVALLLGSGTLQAQESSAVDRASTAGPSAANGWEMWAGYSPKSTDLGVIGRHPDLSLGIVALRYDRRISALANRHVYYTFDLIPFARVAPLIRYHPGDPATTDNSRCHLIVWRGDCSRSTVPARGGGFNPVGFTVVQTPARLVQWRLGANGGVLWFDRPTPSDIATRFNFTGSVEAGLQLAGRSGRAVSLVYRMHHLSNAGRGSDNLAMLSHVFSAALRWR